MKKFVLRIALMCGVIATPPFSAQAAVSPEFVGHMRRLLDLYDTVEQIDRGLIALSGEPAVMPAEVLEDIAAQQRRLDRHHPTSRVPALKVSADQTFSSDADERRAVRDRYRQYLKDSDAEMERFHEKRSQIANRRSDWQKYRDVVARSEGVFKDACANSKHPVTYDSFCGAALDLEDKLGPSVQGVLSAYDRVLKDYDRLIQKRSEETDRMRDELEAIEILQGERALKPLELSAPDEGAPGPHPGPSHATRLAGKFNVAGARASTTVGDKVAVISQTVDRGSRRANELRWIGREQMRDAMEHRQRDAERKGAAARDSDTVEPRASVPPTPRSESPAPRNSPAPVPDTENQKTRPVDDDAGTMRLP